MRHMPDGPELDAASHARIGPTPPGRPTPALVVGNEPGLRVRPRYGADTATGVALNIIRSPDATSLLSGIEGVTSSGFNGDRLLAMWALCNPAAATERAVALVAAARACEFGVARTEAAMQIACFIRTYPEESGIADGDELYADLLSRVQQLLDSPKDFDLFWVGEYSDVLQSGSMLGSGAVQIEDAPELDLTIVQTPLRLHDLTRFTAATHTRLLTVRSENTYTLEYRRESWVQFPEGRPLPRIELRPLAQRLNLFERAQGTWRAEPVSEPAPRLYLDAGQGRAAPSLIDAATVIEEVRAYLRDGARRPELHWTPYSAKESGQ
jgi:hypothetical protein